VIKINFEWIYKVSYLTVPLILCAVGTIILFSKNKNLFSEFTKGAEDGLKSAIGLLPVLASLITAVSMFSASDAGEIIAELLSPVVGTLGIPAELIPFLVIRPVSGGASMAMLGGILEEYGAESFVGRCAAVIMGSSDTVIYIIAVYFASVNIRKTRYALPAAFLTMMFSVFLCCAVSRLFFA